MKKKPLILIPLLIVVFATGCLVRSLNPLYTEKDVIFDPALIGVWEPDNDNKEKWEFQKGEGKSYKLIHTDERTNRAIFEVHLVKLRNRKFLDILVVSFEDDSGKDIGEKLNNFGLFHIWPVHTFMRVDSIGDELKLRLFNLEWLLEKLQQNPKAIKHLHFGNESDENILLTASTYDLQHFILKNVETDAFKYEIVLKRKK
jgi:hypothetical protein